VLDLAGLFPFFIQIACSAFFEELIDGGGDLRRSRAAFLEEAEPHFNYIVEHFDDDQRRVLGDIVANRTVPPSRSYLLTKLRRDGYLLEPRDGGRTLSGPPPRERLFSSAFAARFLESGVSSGEIRPERGPDRSNSARSEIRADAGEPAETPDGHRPFVSGSQVGNFRIRSLVGAGGMGVVYRARDLRLDRDVAIKVLSDNSSGNPQRLARFEREARMLAALNHPNIGAIYGFEEWDGQRGLILEFIEGPTLADLIAGSGSRTGARGLAVKEAFALARQIASALEAAHAKGILHRDLKPANIKVTPGGIVKVLDFGLAKAWLDESADSRSQSPTMTAPETQAGIILGTAAYMSPEQARGKPLDKRTDIWSFGCIVLEMLTGQAAFAGETLSDTLARILEREPDWQALPPQVPHQGRELVRRCLQKDPNVRLHDIADARVQLDELASEPGKGGGVLGLFARLSRRFRS
jgi:hypothetical protein